MLMYEIKSVKFDRTLDIINAVSKFRLYKAAKRRLIFLCDTWRRVKILKRRLMKF